MAAACAMNWNKQRLPLNGRPGVPVSDRRVEFDAGFRADILVDRQSIVETKAVANIVPAHDAQVLPYLRMSGLRLGLLFNFHARLLKDGPRRFVV
jgi:GxxExxY protein